MGRSGIRAAYATGRGKITVRARAEIEENEKTGRSKIIVTELPYQVNKARPVSYTHLVEISAGKRHILFKIENYTVISSLLEGEFLNYKAAIPPESKTDVIVRTRDAIESVERVSLLITDRLKSPVRCLFEENEIKLNCTTSMGRASDQLSADMTGENVEIGFNNRYLLEALRNTECDEVKIQLGGSLSPMKIVPKEGDSFLFLVLPVRLKND